MRLELTTKLHCNIVLLSEYSTDYSDVIGYEKKVNILKREQDAFIPTAGVGEWV